MDEQTAKTSRRKISNGAGVCGSNCPCGCGGCCWQFQRACPITRWFLGLIIVVFVFWCGMKIGEIKTELRDGGYGRGFYSRYEFSSPQRLMIVNDTLNGDTVATSSKK